MDVKDAVEKRISVRAFRPDAVPLTLVRTILDQAQRAPSGGNLQPWRVHALTGDVLTGLKAAAVAKMAEGGEETEYEVYPSDLWEPYRTRRYQCGEDLYATLNIARDDKRARYAQLANNLQMFGAPVGLFFTLDRRVGPPQWSDVGMYMQTVMLLAVEQGLDTCAQEFWARLPQTVGRTLGLPDHEMLFCGMALGWREEAHPINSLRTRRDPLEIVAAFHGF